MFGIRMVDMRLKVTQDPTVRDNFASIPCQMGFKQQDGNWANIWCKVKAFGGHINVCHGIQKGDRITVSGSMKYETREYNGKVYEDWVVMVGDNDQDAYISVDGGASRPTKRQHAEETGWKNEPDQFDDQLPF